MDEILTSNTVTLGQKVDVTSRSADGGAAHYLDATVIAIDPAQRTYTVACKTRRGPLQIVVSDHGHEDHTTYCHPAPGH